MKIGFDRHMLLPKDISEQKPARYWAFITKPEIGMSLVLSVDSIKAYPSGSVLTLPDGKLAMFTPDISIAVLPSEHYDMITREQEARMGKDANDRAQAVQRELFPEEVQAQEHQRRRMLQNMGVDDRPAPEQYA